MNADELKGNFIAAFKELTHCPHTFFPTENEEEKVIDSATLKYSCFGNDEDPEIVDEKYFRVKNPSKQKIYLWAIDNKLLKKAGARCDCTLFSEKDFCFIEFKTNATSLNETAIENNYQKAYDQLKCTATLILDKAEKVGVNLFSEMENIEAYMVKAPTIPALQASEIAFATRFIEETGIDLLFENTKTF